MPFRNELPEITLGADHALPLYVYAWVPHSTAAQNVLDVQETSEKYPAVSRVTGALQPVPLKDDTSPFQLDVVVLKMPLAIMQKLEEVHETAATASVLLSTTVGPDHVLPLYWNAFPFASTATQKLAEGHETASNAVVPSMFSGADHADPVNVRTFPPLSTAMQNVVLAQETSFRECPASMAAGACHPKENALAGNGFSMNIPSSITATAV